MPKSKQWFVYVLQCRNGSLYTGIATDLVKRFEAHAEGRGSRAVRMAGGPVAYLYTHQVEGRGQASKWESFIQSMSRKQKRTFLDLAGKKLFVSIAHTGDMRG